MEGQDLKRLRLEVLRFGLREFAEHIGVLPSDYYEMETGKQLPSRKVLIIYLKLKEVEEWVEYLDPRDESIVVQGFLLGIRNK